jgi:hypothetical protein
MEKVDMNSRQRFYQTPVLLVVDSNPKKKGSMSWERFQNYFTVDKEYDDYTVQDCLDAGVRMDDIRHDSEHGFILLGEEAIEAYRAKAPKEMTAADLGL